MYVGLLTKIECRFAVTTDLPGQQIHTPPSYKFQEYALSYTGFILWLEMRSCMKRPLNDVVSGFLCFGGSAYCCCGRLGQFLLSLEVFARHSEH